MNLNFQNLGELMALFGTLGGVGALIAALINVLKTIGVVKDGQAPAVSTGLNLLGLILLFVIGVIKPDFDLAGADRFAGELAGLLITVFGFIWQLVVARMTHDKLRGIGVIGKSYTIDRNNDNHTFLYEQAHRE